MASGGVAGQVPVVVIVHSGHDVGRAILVFRMIHVSTTVGSVHRLVCRVFSVSGLLVRVRGQGSNGQYQVVVLLKLGLTLSPSRQDAVGLALYVSWDAHSSDRVVGCRAAKDTKQLLNATFSRVEKR